MHAGSLISLTVSMVDGGFLDKLEVIARFIRTDTRPFGGIQLILCGKRSNYGCTKLTHTKATSISFLPFRTLSMGRNCRLLLRSTREHGQLVSLKRSPSAKSSVRPIQVSIFY